MSIRPSIESNFLLENVNLAMEYMEGKLQPLKMFPIGVSLMPNILKYFSLSLKNYFSLFKIDKIKEQLF